ncbi:Rab guanine nucleotide exchange factor SEC2 [Golovinomyces cichoracearum]|uniref:Rab guanine nucleotide exchange factor SEC2 n=1 Tax=Golovinomyces cichoracearum TaxID=62708 RepID=A0A420IWY5_9PEZI|nr:Rab guanine nucleotide exchange factor SEC2 [Golovinomyces cichoracearum]
MDSEDSTMSDITSVAELTQRNHTRIKSPLTHLRSFSSHSASLSSTSSPRMPIPKSISFSNLKKMTDVTHSYGVMSPNRNFSYGDEDKNLSTLPDPRSRAITPTFESPIPSPHHPDLNTEVATLSNKLIHAINHQTSLDDTLSTTRYQLAAALERVKNLERENKKHIDLIARGYLVRKSATDIVHAKMAASLSEERRKRIEIENEKKNLEQELENLTTALFEEANKMVISAREEARREVEVTQKKNDQLRAQILDTESLLKSQQDQLTELKLVIEQMTLEHEDQIYQTSPSSPGFSKSNSKKAPSEEVQITYTPVLVEPETPTHPTNLTHLLQTVLRTDIPSFQEFVLLLKMSNNNTSIKRASTGSYTGLGLSLGLASPSTNFPASSVTSFPISPSNATVPMSTISRPSSSHTSNTHLKDTKFYKRVLVEDIEPTLRLDSAPGLSWLARRTVANAICEGTLIVEPIPSSNQSSLLPCALCGESRNEPLRSRSHLFKLSGNENAQRYPLCTYCLGRLRSTCDFLGFLRILKDGHWKCDDEESERSAWEECVRYREQMFWSRLGGGVRQIIHNHYPDLKGPHNNRDQNKDLRLENFKAIKPKINDELEDTVCTEVYQGRTSTETDSISSPSNTF